MANECEGQAEEHPVGLGTLREVSDKLTPEQKKEFMKMWEGEGF